MDSPVGLRAEAELVELAAFGDPDAQAELALHCATKLFAGLTPLEAAILAEAFASQAAVHGRPQDQLLFAGVLRVRANHVSQLGDAERAGRLLTRSEAICDQVASVPLCGGLEYLIGVLVAEADAGGEVGELSAIRLQRLFDRMTPAAADKLRREVARVTMPAAEAVASTL